MEIGTVFTYDGRTYVLLGFEPMSVPDRRAELQDAETGEVVRIPWSVLARSSEGLPKHP
jgi:hypothetical protein